MPDFFRIWDDELDPSSAFESVRDPDCGAIATFVGTVRGWNVGREVLELDYEVHDSMALAQFERMAGKLKDSHGVTHVAIHHRRGVCFVGDVSVVIAVSSPRRRHALAACTDAIERLKKDVPIWKKEVFHDGHRWVEGSWSAHTVPDGGQPAPRRAIYVISDSTGETGAKVVQAALLQFRHEHVRLRIFSNMRDPVALADTVDRAAGDGALIVYTLVDARQRLAVHDRAAQYSVQAVDLMGPLMMRIGRWLGESPVSRPGLLHRLDEEYFRRIEAMEFAVKNDDGKLPRNFKQADIIIVGVSRTSKTPVSATLAQKGHKCANLPLVMGVQPPKEIDEVDPQRVFALQIAPRTLFEIRRARLTYLGVEDKSQYADLEQIQQELAWARDIFRAHPSWTILDVSNRAVEETASAVLKLYASRFGPE